MTCDGTRFLNVAQVLALLWSGGYPGSLPTPCRVPPIRPPPRWLLLISFLCFLPVIHKHAEPFTYEGKSPLWPHIFHPWWLAHPPSCAFLPLGPASLTAGQECSPEVIPDLLIPRTRAAPGSSLPWASVTSGAACDFPNFIEVKCLWSSPLPDTPSPHSS